ncbi:MAG: radical SAM protein [Planctomycetota bacterium]
MDQRGLVTRAEEARAHDRQCLLCEHRCGVDRAAGVLGQCRAGTEARVFRHRVEYGEEPELVPSHLFYLSGCDLRCAFCIAEERAFDPRIGTPLSGPFLRRAVEWGLKRGARTLQWVGGEPTIHLPAILRALAQVPSPPPIVWKSDFHGTPEAFALLRGVVDVHVADFKFGNDACALRIAGVQRYVEIVTRNLVLAAADARLIVRHLLLPGHFECCFLPIVRWITDTLPGARVSIRDGYLPKWQARHHDDLRGPLDPDAGAVARREATMLGLDVVE